MTVYLYTLYDHTTIFHDFENIPEESWEILKRFDLDKASDFNDFCAQIDTNYFKHNALDLIYHLISNGFYYDYVNEFKYVLELD